jgi:excisionase family DNA binding protein
MMSDAGAIDPNGIYSIGDAARLLGVSASTLRDLERRGQLDCTRTPGGQRRFAGSELLRLLKQSKGAPPKQPAPPSPHIAVSAEDAKARQVWLGQLIAGAQRELPTDTPAEIRLRLGADLERALGNWGPTSPMGHVEPLIKSLVQRATIQAETAQEEAERHKMKGELVDFALAHLRRGIDLLPKRVVGVSNSLKRRHVRATLRDQLRDALRKRLHGDESWDQVRELTDEFIAAWYVEQTPDSRVPNTVKFLAVGATGVVGGVAAAAALDPRIRAAATELKGPLLSLARDLLSRLSSSPPPPSPLPPPPEQTAAAPPSFQPGMGLGAAWLRSDRTARRFRRTTSTSSKAPRGNVPASDSQAAAAPPTDTDTGPIQSPGTSSPSS